MTMEIRSITPEEVASAQALYRNAFRITMEMARRWNELTDLSRTRAVVEDGRVLSILTIHDFEVWMFGKRMRMGGIGGVATFADQQGRGLAGKLIEQSILDMRDEGQVISILYPFSYQFYGRFGYTICGDYVTYTAIPADFRAFAENEYRVRAAELDRDLPAIREVYDTTAPMWNCMMNRDDARWERWVDFWSEDRRHVYIIESADDHTPEGFFCIEDVPVAERRFDARVLQVVLGSDALLPCLARFLGRLPKNVSSVQVTVPRTPMLWQMFREPSVSTQVFPSFQARVIDVAKACEQRGYESDVEAEFVFGVDDMYAPWNAGPWRLQVSDGIAEIAPADVDGEYLVLTIQEFTTIFTGYQKASDVVLTPGPFVEELETMDELFYDGDTRLLDYF